MNLRSIRIQNFKGFLDSGEIRFSSGFNFVVGQNNAGKSALLEALGIRIPAKPHISLETKPTEISIVDPNSQVEVLVSATGEEVRETLMARGAPFSMIWRTEFSSPNPNSAVDYLGQFLGQESIEFRVRFGSLTNTVEIVPQSKDEFFQGGSHSAVFNVNVSKKRFEYANFDGHMQLNREIGAHVAEMFRERMYTFRAERLNVGECDYGNRSNLASDASNLPEVINFLQGNPTRFARFNRFVNQIFPSIRQVSVKPRKDNSKLEILVWTVDPNTEREDLAVSLSESGTGVGQVLAILYVAITSTSARTIVIDEPNSFLHPGAARKLIEILREFKNQQYIVSTHAAEVIGAVDVGTLSLVRWVDLKSRVDQLDVSSLDALKAVLREVGARLADVFGADRILWVEGSTEEACFPLVVDRVLKARLAGTSIVAVRDTGSFESKRPSASQIWEIYENLSKAGSLVPPAVAFCFDRESRTPQEFEDLRRRSNGKVHFLPRRMLENYLLDFEAISALLVRLTGLGTQDSKVSEVSNWVESRFREFVPRASGDVASLSFNKAIVDIDAASLLKALFQDFTESKHEFRKSVHSFALMDWITLRKPESLTELASYLGDILNLDEEAKTVDATR